MVDSTISANENIKRRELIRETGESKAVVLEILKQLLLHPHLKLQGLFHFVRKSV